MIRTALFAALCLVVSAAAAAEPLKTAPVANCAVVPLENPARLLVTFTPERSASSETDSSRPGS